MLGFWPHHDFPGVASCSRVDTQGGRETAGFLVFLLFGAPRVNGGMVFVGYTSSHRCANSASSLALALWENGLIEPEIGTRHCGVDWAMPRQCDNALMGDH